mgnify:CR=1 FL=1
MHEMRSREWVEHSRWNMHRMQCEWEMESWRQGMSRMHIGNRKGRMFDMCSRDREMHEMFSWKWS